MSKVIIIGGGAAGMFAALGAVDAGHQVTILEQNEKLGKKIYITGKGRCNLTNACETSEIFENIPRNPNKNRTSQPGNYAIGSFLGCHCNPAADFKK